MNEFMANLEPGSDERWGSYAVILRREPLRSDGEILGFEVLGYDFGLEHSMFCVELVEACFEEYGVRPNAVGHYDTFTEAKQCADYANYVPIDAPVENSNWYPMLVVQYPLPER
jgi:hypothetical protein